jgi:transposase
MMAALIAGERDPKVLAQLARARMRIKISQLEEAFVGRFSGHHAFLLTKMLARIDAIDADIAEVETRIEEQIAPFADAVARLDSIPGAGVTTANVIIAEVGLDMTRFPTAAQLASWAKFSPTVQSAGKKEGPERHRPRQLLPGQSRGRGGDLGRQDRHLPRRAVPTHRPPPGQAEGHRRCRPLHPGHRLAPADPEADFVDLGPDFYDIRGGPQRAIRNHVRHLEALGYQVTLQPAA